MSQDLATVQSNSLHGIDAETRIKRKAIAILTSAGIGRTLVAENIIECKHPKPFSLEGIRVILNNVLNNVLHDNLIEYDDFIRHFLEFKAIVKGFLTCGLTTVFFRRWSCSFRDTRPAVVTSLISLIIQLYEEKSIDDDSFSAFLHSRDDQDRQLLYCYLKDVDLSRTQSYETVLKLMNFTNTNQSIVDWNDDSKVPISSKLLWCCFMYIRPSFDPTIYPTIYDTVTRALVVRSLSDTIPRAATLVKGLMKFANDDGTGFWVQPFSHPDLNKSSIGRLLLEGLKMNCPEVLECKQLIDLAIERREQYQMLMPTILHSALEQCLLPDLRAIVLSFVPLVKTI